MTNWNKIKEIYKYLNWEYYGYNDSNNQLEKAYFAPANKKDHLKISVHDAPDNEPDWNFVIRLANLLNYTLFGSPYIINRAVNEMYDFVIKMNADKKK